jgi:hypothetical protein
MAESIKQKLKEPQQVKNPDDFFDNLKRQQMNLSNKAMKKEAQKTIPALCVSGNLPGTNTNYNPLSANSSNPLAALKKAPAH